MTAKFLMCGAAALAAVSIVFAASTREWQSGTLMETEQQQVHSGTMKTTNTDGKAKTRGNKTDYSANSTSHTTEDYDTYQIYTIKGPHKTYVARERLLFPWSKPANVTVGEAVKFAVEKNKIYLLDEDGKEHKASVSKVKVNSSE